MRRTNLRKKIILLIAAFIILAVPAYTVYYFAATRIVKVDAEHITAFTLTQTGSKHAKKYAGDTASVRLKKTQTYAFSYTAAGGYQNGIQTVAATDTVVTVRPDYSSDKLNSMLEAELGTINDVITRSGTNIAALYTIDRGTLSNNGNWYITTLTYKGSIDDDDSDTLVVGLQKKDGTWVTVLAPDIIFTKYAYPNAASDFIEAANDYQRMHVNPRGE